MSMTANVATLIRNWTGSAPPPVVLRKASARWGAATPTARELAVRVVDIVEETPTVRTFVVEPREGRLAYAAGQHLTLVLDKDGETLRRCYSLSTSPLSHGRAAFSVRRVEGGRVSTWLHDSVRVGDLLEATPPSGSFTLPGEDSGECRFVMVAGGVGITPLVALAETALRRDARAEVVLLCGHRRTEEIVFRSRLEDLEREFAPRLRVRIALDEAGPGWAGLAGAMSGARVLEEAGTEADAYYVCGPEPMMDDVAAALAGAGVDPARVRVERFAYAPPAPVAAPAGAREILFARSGRRVVAEPGQTVLEAATKAGVALPFSCTMGGCGACKVRKSQGTVVTSEPNCLGERERAEGWLLTCCSWADDGLVIADY